MKILITGGAGFIGSNLGKYLLEKNYQVTAVDNLITGTSKNIEDLLNNPLFKFVEMDITQPDFKDRFIKQEPFDLIFHLASPASPIQYDRYPLETLMVNSLGTKNVLDLSSVNHKTKVIYASTSEVYGDPMIHPQVESYWGNVNSYGPRSCYDESKRFGEALCYTYLNKYQADVRIVRIFNTYGPNMEKCDGRVVSNFIVAAIINAPLIVSGEGKQTRSFCYVSDLIEGLYLMSQKPVQGEVINLGNPNELTILEIAKKIIQLTKSSSKIIFQPLPKDDPKKRKPNITKAKELLGWEPKIDLELGLQKTINYFEKLTS